MSFSIPCISGTHNRTMSSRILLHDTYHVFKVLMIQLKRGFSPPFLGSLSVYYLKVNLKKKKKCLLLLFSCFVLFFTLWDQNLSLCRELDMLKHEFGTQQCSEKSQLWAQKWTVCPGVPQKCLARAIYSRLILVQCLSVDLCSSPYQYFGRCNAVKPWRTWPCDGCQHPLTVAQLLPWCLCVC